MARMRKSTAVHRTGHADKITEILKDKGMRGGFQKYKELINEKFGLDLTGRQIRYFHNNYVKPKEAVTPKQTQEKIEDRREMVNVAVEQMDLYDEQSERLQKVLELDARKVVEELPEDANKDLLVVLSTLTKMKRREFELTMEILKDIKETKQELGLMSKEPERLEIKTEKEVDVDITEFREEEIKSLAMAMAGVEDYDER